MDPQKCLANAKIVDPSAVLCADAYCNGGGVSKYLDARCHCRKPYEQNPCPYSADSPVWVDNGTPNGCYCCCSCFAYGTEIMDGYESKKRIETFSVGDTILVATQDLTWVERVVEFSEGVAPNEENGKTVVTIYYKLGDEHQKLVVTPDHVFFVYNEDLKKRKLTRAEQLDISRDRLIDGKGQLVAMLGKETGGWYGGLHHIATTQDASENPDYHLLLSNGVVTGDWALQISKLHDLADIAVEVAPDWNPQKPAGRSGFRQVAKGFTAAEYRPEGFVPYDVSQMSIPRGALLFLRTEQADDIYKHTRQYPISVNGLQEVAYYLFHQFHNYYRDVYYFLQWEEDWPNAFAYQEFGVNFVVITGGLVRTEGITIDGLLMILASTTGRIVGGAPAVSQNPPFSCVGQSDYFATLAVLRNILFTQDYRVRTTTGLNEIRVLFDYIDPRHRAGQPGNTCDKISTECRLEAFTAGRGMLPLPECAGGARTDYLEVLNARAQRDGASVEIIAFFNKELDVLSAQETQNYVLQPRAAITSVEVPAKQRDTVVITSKLKPGTDYTLTMRNLLSKSGLAFDDDKAVVNIKFPS